MTYISFDPWLQKENTRFPESTDDQIDELVSSVYKGWNEWRRFGNQDKRLRLLSLAGYLMDEKKKLANIITSEMGKPISQSAAEIEKCSSLCYYYAENLERFSTPEKRSSSSGESYIQYSPQGIILGIMPWNFPWWQAFRFIIPVLAGGNVVLLKHASNVPLCAEQIAKSFCDVGFPDNICRNMFASYDQVVRVIARQEVRGVSLTGSKVAGKKIAALSGSFLKKTVLELGGNDPFIIFDDADIETAADAALYSRFQNCGQSCIAAKRLYVQSGIYDGFLSAFTSKVKKIKVGDPYDPETFIGPMVNETSLECLHNQVADALETGARLITGGTRYAKDKPVYNPTILVDVPPASPVLTEELFGPVIPVIRFEDSAGVIAMANNSVYGLGASVWTADKELAWRVADAIDTGTVSINGFVRSDPALPFGGVKDSGYGRELSVEGFREFLNIKGITVFS